MLSDGLAEEPVPVKFRPKVVRPSAFALESDAHRAAAEAVSS